MYRSACAFIKNLLVNSALRVKIMKFRNTNFLPKNSFSGVIYRFTTEQTPPRRPPFAGKRFIAALYQQKHMEVSKSNPRTLLPSRKRFLYSYPAYISQTSPDFCQIYRQYILDSFCTIGELCFPLLMHRVRRLPVCNP